MRCALALAAAPGVAQAQGYPTRSITVVVPFPAGGPSDVVARIVTEAMGKSLGQSMVIENVGGAGGTIGSARVAAAAPDGYTLLAGSMGSHVSAPVLTPNIKYDSERDFVPIGFTAHAPAVIVARKDFPAEDLREFVAYLKQNGDKVKQAHGGIGASSHMACLLFNSVGRRQPDVGRLSRHRAGHERPDRRPRRLSSASRPSASPRRSQAGTIKAFAVSSAERLAALPDVPTAKEPGVDYQMSIWAGIFAPKGTPKPIVDRLAAALDKALDDPSVQKRLAELGGSIPQGRAHAGQVRGLREGARSRAGRRSSRPPILPPSDGRVARRSCIPDRTRLLPTLARQNFGHGGQFSVSSSARLGEPASHWRGESPWRLARFL